MTSQPAARGARFRRTLVAVVVAVAVLPGAASAAARVAADEGPDEQGQVQHGQAERGIAQAVGADWLTLRTLDGAIFTVRVAPKAKVSLDGRRARLRDVGRGFVVAIAFASDGSARSLEAYSPTRPAKPAREQKGRGERGERGRFRSDTR
jgi:hypothetical protein